MSKASKKKSSEPRQPRDRKENLTSMRFEKLRAEYLASGDLTQAGKVAGYSEKYIRVHYRALREKLEADPLVISSRQQIQEDAIATAKEKRALLWQVAQAAAAAMPVKDAEGNETGEYRLDARGAVEAVKELNRMDGDHAELQVRHKGKVGVGHSFDPETMTDDEINAGIAEFAHLLGKSQVTGAAEGEEAAG